MLRTHFSPLSHFPCLPSSFAGVPARPGRPEMRGKGQSRAGQRAGKAESKQEGAVWVLCL